MRKTWFLQNQNAGIVADIRGCARSVSRCVCGPAPPFKVIGRGFECRSLDYVLSNRLPRQSLYKSNQPLYKGIIRNQTVYKVTISRENCSFPLLTTAETTKVAILLF